MTISPARAVAFAKSRFRELGTKERADGERAYMKSELRFHGVTADHVRDAAKDFARENAPSHDAIVAIVDALYATDWFDLRSFAIAILERNVKQLTAADAPWLVELARTSACWAHVDFLSTKAIGPLVDRNPALWKSVDAWAKDRDFWVRRVALLTHLGSLRKGAGDFDRFARIAAPMLDEREFFIRKAIGWVLREVSKKRPALVFDFFRAHGDRASPLTWREGTKYLPDAMNAKLAKIRAAPRRSP
jgi:3-methyladenine DNA glycosylase AlkD